MPTRPKPKTKPKTRTKTKRAENQLALIARDLVKDGGSVADIGIILGCLADDYSELTKLKRECNNMEEFLAITSRRADVALVEAAIRAATGYDYEETTQEFMPCHDESGRFTGEEVPGKIKRVKKKNSGDATLLWKLIASRMPQFFSETKRIEIDKRTIEIKGDAESEIRGFAGKLLAALGEEQEAKFVESETS